LLALGVLSSLVDLGAVGVSETRRANNEQQRVIIDAKTGIVAGLKTEDVAAEAFDVAAEPTKPTEEPAGKTPGDKPPATETAPEPASTPSPKGLLPLQLKAPVADVPTIARSSDSLVSAPAPEITERLGELVLPKRGEKDARPSSLYAKSFTRADDPLLAIVVTDAGFSDESIRLLLDLPMEVTVAISPYATNTAVKIEALRNKGHEVWAMLPAMTSRYPQDDPGPLGLIAGQDPKEMRGRLMQVLAATVGSVGVVLPVDESLSKTPIWQDVLGAINARGLEILSTHPSHAIESMAATPELQAIIQRADLVLDSTPATAFIVSKLAGIKDSAIEKKKMVVVLSARPKALLLLSDWLKQKPLADDVQLAPLSAIYAPDKPVEVEAPKEEGGHH
jgi:polysaccharide deacetylase 2 family uncharacterized protein YibQ